MGFSVTLMVLLMVGSTAFMPLVLPLLIPTLKADPWSIAGPLVVLMLLPLGIGLAINARFAPLARWSLLVLKPIVNISLILLTVLLIGLNLSALIGTIGSGAILVSILYVGITFGLGYALGGPDPGNRRVLALGTSQRNIAAALVTATSSGADPDTVVMLLVTTIVGLVLLLPVASRLKGRSGDEQASPSPRVELPAGHS
jgi:BASS family bile acid:Na+ symporter